MTTIAYDGNIIAADGQVTDDDTITDTEVIKLYNFVTEGGADVVVAYTGALEGKTRFESWASCQAISDSQEDLWAELELEGLVFEALVVGKNCLSFEEGRHPSLCHGAQALGNGAKFALAAMKCGKNAIEAVEIASQLDIYTGGKITAYKRDGSKWILID